MNIEQNQTSANQRNGDGDPMANPAKADARAIAKIGAIITLCLSRFWYVNPSHSQRPLRGHF
jgi:hypothetical protein